MNKRINIIAVVLLLCFMVVTGCSKNLGEDGMVSGGSNGTGNQAAIIVNSSNSEDSSQSSDENTNEDNEEEPETNDNSADSDINEADIISSKLIIRVNNKEVLVNGKVVSYDAGNEEDLKLKLKESIDSVITDDMDVYLDYMDGNYDISLEIKNLLDEMAISYIEGAGNDRCN